MSKVLTILLTIITIITFNTSVDATNTPFVYNNYTEINQLDTFTNVVIFIRFADETTYNAPYALDYYDQMLNGLDQVSLRDYYLEVSYNQLDIVSYLVTDNSQIIYYTDTHTRDYYSPYDASTNTQGYATDNESRDREHNLLKDALYYVEDNNLVPDTLDIDKNNDGEIDSLTFMVSGEDEGWSELLWPHKWELYSFYDFGAGNFEVDAPTINGKYAYYYTFELLGDSTSYYYSVNVGVLAHETFHLLSAPDLYHYYRYDWIEPIGDWGLMDSAGRTPSHMLGYMKLEYGSWMGNIPEIATSGDYTLYPLQDGNTNLYKIDLGYSNEYIYLEYRDNIGLYESNLPSSGLLVYRVDFDYEGNEEGYYNESGTPQDEVFIFRPGIIDNSFPIEFSHEDVSFVDEDGNIDEAALSQSNTINEVGKGTDDPMFYSDGTEIDIKIYNVEEKNGYLTFSVLYDGNTPPLEPKIKLQTDETIYEDTTLYLVDLENTAYYAEIIDLDVTHTAYYTVDGTTPSTASTLYDGSILVTSELNQVKVAIYEDTTLLHTSEKTFNFTDSIESLHSNYLNDQHITWYTQFQTPEDFHIFSNNQFEVEENYDEVKITVDGSTMSYTGASLQQTVLDYTGTNLVVEFISNYSNDDFYGLYFDVITGDLPSISLTGSEITTHTINTVYTDEGVTETNSREGFSVVTTDNVDSTTLGTYVVTYELYTPKNELLQSVTRTVTVLDDQAPFLTLNGDESITIELGFTYTDEGVTSSDNYDNDLEFIISNDVDITTVGTYYVSYYAVDDAGNISNTVTRTVTVEDTSPLPIIELQTTEDISDEAILFLVDTENTEYYAEITNLRVNYTAYYTVDGSTPTKLSNQYDESILITSDFNQLKIAIYDGTTLIDTIERTFNFTDSIETLHDNYLNNQYTIWYVQFQSQEEFHLFSNNQFEIENDNDELRITLDGSTLSYTGTSLQHTILDYSGTSLVVEFLSNETNNEYYGINLDVIVGDMITLELNGEATLNHTINTIYTDEGVEVYNNREGYYVEITNNVDEESFGTYVITYELYNEEDELLQHIARSVTVLDNQAPVLSIKEESLEIIELGSTYIDSGITYSDNYDSDLEFFITNNVDTSAVGEYTVSYYAKDAAGNISETVTRTVNVVDTTPPVVTLQPGVDTIYVNETYSDAGVVYTDLDSVTVETTSTVDTTKSGSYIITYTAKDSSNNETSIIRYVTVINKVQNIIPICEQTLTTYLINEEYEIPNCTVNNYVIEPITTYVNNTVSGTYEIVYKYQINSITYTKVIYITFVSDIQKPVAFIEQKRRDTVWKNY